MSGCKDCNSARRAWSQEELLNLFNQAPNNSVPVGARVFVSSVYRNYFDTSGLGNGIWQGWAICNGNNGTINLLGLIPLIYNPTDPNPIFQVGDQSIDVDIAIPGAFTLGFKTMMLAEKIS